MSNNSHCKKLLPACQLLFRRWMVEIKAKASSCSRERLGRTPPEQHVQPWQETSLPYMHLPASPSPPPGQGPTPISSFSPLHFIALARLFSQGHLKLLSPLFLTAVRSKVGFRHAVRLCIAACRALLFCRLSTRDRARAIPSGGHLQRLWPQPSPSSSMGQEHCTAPCCSALCRTLSAPHKPRYPTSSTASCSHQHPGSKNRWSGGTYMCDGPSVGDGRFRRGSGRGCSLGDASSRGRAEGSTCRTQSR